MVMKVVACSQALEQRTRRDVLVQMEGLRIEFGREGLDVRGLDKKPTRGELLSRFKFLEILHHQRPRRVRCKSYAAVGLSKSHETTSLRRPRRSAARPAPNLSSEPSLSLNPQFRGTLQALGTGFRHGKLLAAAIQCAVLDGDEAVTLQRQHGPAKRGAIHDQLARKGVDRHRPQPFQFRQDRKLRRAQPRLAPGTDRRTGSRGEQPGAARGNCTAGAVSRWREAWFLRA